MLRKIKENYYSNQINENKNDQKKIFQIVKNLLHRKYETIYPKCDNVLDLPNEFNSFFKDKVTNIRLNFTSNNELPKELISDKYFTRFHILDNEKVSTLIKSAASKSCILDPVPTVFLKLCSDIPELLIFIKTLVNKSLQSGIFPGQFKKAIVTPILKKNSNPNFFKNFRPISNLCFLSKLVEKAAAEQLMHYIQEHDHNEMQQSAYKIYHSTETALIKVKNDILRAIDKQCVSLLVLLDLSAAFDTVDIDILLQRLHLRFGVKGSAFDWFSSYLRSRSQSVFINGCKSSEITLTCGVPQGSILGPILFTIYTSPLGDIIRKYNLSYHLYADDCQLYLSFKPYAANEAIAYSTLKHAVDEIKNWMWQNKLKLNEDKTEFLIIGRKSQCAKVTQKQIMVGQTAVNTSLSVRNLGVFLIVSLT